MIDQDPPVPPAAETDAPVAMADAALDTVSGGLTVTLPNGQQAPVFVKPSAGAVDELTHAWQVLTGPRG